MSPGEQHERLLREALKGIDGWLGPAEFSPWERWLAPEHIINLATNVGHADCLNHIVYIEETRPGVITITGERDMGLYDAER